MRTARRLVKDEAGMTMALAIMMILLLGVMGAGLLTFVSRDLNTVVEQNKGQRAFGAADAGIEAAKRQLADNVDRTAYDGDGAGNCVSDDTDDIQWSALLCDGDLDDDISDGLTLNDLDDDGSTPDSVTVRIRYCAKASSDPECAEAGSPPSEEYFRVVSTGTYGDPPQQAKRRIEGRFEGDVTDPGCEDDDCELGHPVYYTPSNIRITHPTSGSEPMELNQISLFSGKDIMIQGDRTQTDFTNDYGGGNSGAYKNSTSTEELCDWKSDHQYQTNCYKNNMDTWNTRARSECPILNACPEFVSPGFAAEDTICGLPLNADNIPANTPVIAGACPTGATSIADGVRGYDRTTGPFDGLNPSVPNANKRGQQLSFKRKEPLPNGTYPRNDNDGTISYPFPPLDPKAEAFRDQALKPGNQCFDFNPSTTNCPQPPTSNSSWGLTSNTSTKFVFIDAGNRTLTFNPGGNTSGILVVWCGRLLQKDNFEGIILNLYGSSLPNSTGGSLPGDTDCHDPNTPAATSANAPYGGPVGTYVNVGSTPLGPFPGNNNGTTCSCWVYAKGGTDNVAGIEFLPGAKAKFRPALHGSFKSNTSFFDTPQPTSFALRSWRELYE